ncbi:MAG: HD domain-containing protein [Oscillospiraceae bacterium]|nr:HD domain-containing protein [Oscillospiraceae bacterium]
MIAIRHIRSQQACNAQEIRMTIQSLSNKGRFASEKTFLHHRKITVYDHSVHVAEVSLAIANSLPFSFDMDSLIRGALLHDYFLYHRNESVKTYVTHGYRHPIIAADNAKADYGINDIEENIIRRHMFPLTPMPPKYREAWVVCIADKCCATMEYLPARFTSRYHNQSLN